jgi:hypothetical protein
MILVAFLAFWLVSCGYALISGGIPERIAAGIFLLAFPASRLAFSLGWSVAGLSLGVLIVDLAMLLPMLWIALKANRLWPIPMAAMQALQILGHVLKLADPTMLPLLYWLSRIAWAYPMLVLLVLGTLRHANRERRLGAEQPWSSSCNA